jgi:hypothetical protein
LVVVVQVGGGFVVCPAELIRAAQSNMLSSPSFSRLAQGLGSFPASSFLFSIRVPTSSIRCSEKYTHNTARTDLRKKMKTSQRRNSHTHTLAHLEFVHVAIIVALDGVSIQKMIFEKSFSLVFIFYPPLPSLLENLKIVDMRVFVSFFLSYSVCVYTPISILSLLYIYRAWLAAVKPFGSMSIRIFPLHVPT